MAHSKATIVLVTGAWHPSSAYEDLIALLEKAGYPVLVTTLPSLNPKDPSGCDCTSDAASVREQFLPTIEEGKDVIVLCHSYGGIPAGGAARGLSKSVRMKQGDKGGVVGLIYLSAFVVPEGMSLVDYLGGRHPPYVIFNKVRRE
jgi:pimeloyl-ACP methyl ester carboxylesterase